MTLAPSTPLESAFDSLTESDLRELLRSHYKLQKDGFVTQSHETDGWIRVFSEITPAPVWNHYAWLGRPDMEQLRSLLHTVENSDDHRRRPVVYWVLEPNRHIQVSSIFEQNGFREFEQEVWMWSDPVAAERPARLDELNVRVAGSSPELDDFLKVFYAAFQTRGPGYADALRRSLHPEAEDRRTHHYIAYQGEQPVCVASLMSLGDLACIYNVGTIPSARKRGFAAYLVARLMADSRELGYRQVFLQTEKGKQAERLYSRLGFETCFIRLGYRLTNWAQSESPRRRSGAPGENCDFPQLLGAIRRANATEDSSETLAYTEQSFHPPTGLPKSVQSYCNRTGLEPEIIWLAAWAALLARYSIERKVSFGFRIGANSKPKLLSLTYSENQPVDAWCASVDDAVKSLASDNEGCAKSESFVDLSSGQDQWSTGTTVLLEWRFNPRDLQPFKVHYSRTNVDSGLVHRLVGNLFRLVSGICVESERDLGSLEILTPEERHQLLVEWNKQNFAATEYQSIHRLFESQARENPKALAVLAPFSPSDGHSRESLTYAELNDAANRLAHHLHHQGVQRERVVGICLESSIEMIVALLAVLKAGGVCLPLDPALPQHRLDLILSDSEPVAIISTEVFREAFSRCYTKAVFVEANAENFKQQPIDNLSSTADPDSAAYIIFTSGSTGKPKGVVISNRAIAQHCLDARELYQLRTSDRTLQFNSISFDAAFEQILTPLISGAALLLRGSEVWTVKHFKENVEKYRLTVVDLPTAFWHQLLSNWSRHSESIPKTLPRLFIVGGEMMTSESLELWRNLPTSSVRLINAYGPTETTITATAFEITPEYLSNSLPRRIPIGRPRGGRSAYILDNFNHPVPIGVVGRLHIGGPLLARGYLNKPELTAERFLSNPFTVQDQDRLYDTGDLARYLADGVIEFVGRADRQVKVRGYRIELDELEGEIRAHPGISENVVLATQSQSGDPILVAYFVSKSETNISEAELREHLKRRLPAYMVPTAIVSLPHLPVLPSGKVDRQTLSSLRVDSLSVSDVGPHNPIELRLKLLFQRILHLLEIGVDANFFELGGDSLQALELIVELEREFRKELSFEILYRYSTVESLALFLQNDEQFEAGSSLVPLQTGRGRSPLFLIHTTPGDILGYGSLIHHLDPDQPCFGLQSLGLVKPDQIHTTVSEMAAYYVDQLRSTLTEGPYYLGGWCYGGVVAFEMAQQLTEAGETVAFLGLLETVAPPPPWRVLRYYRHRLKCLLWMNPLKWTSYFSKKIQYRREVQQVNRMRFRRLGASDKIQGQAIESHNRRLAQLEQVYNANLAALKTYRPRPYAGKVTLFNAEVVDAGVIPDPLSGWVGLAAAIETHSVPGDHDTMLSEPNVRILACKFQECLSEAERALAKSCAVSFCRDADRQFSETISL